MLEISILQFAAFQILLTGLRYAVFAVGSYYFFYLLKGKTLRKYRIQSKDFQSKDLRREVYFSLLTIIVFSCAGMLAFYLNNIKLTKVYFEISEHGLAYFLLSFFGLLVAHDTYFYWTHRLLHHPWVLKHVHRIHHLSRNPSPLAAYAFHPLEAALHSGFVITVICLVPLHPAALLLFVMAAMMINVFGHLGYEFYSSHFMISRWRWLNSSTHHNMHHEFIRGNFSLYFNFWDKWCGTNFTEYEQHFENVVNRKIQG